MNAQYLKSVAKASSSAARYGLRHSIRISRRANSLSTSNVMRREFTSSAALPVHITYFASTPYPQTRGLKVEDLNEKARAILYTSLDLGNLGGVKSKFSNIFLRENCPCTQCRHPDTYQRQIDTFSIPYYIKAVEVNTFENEIEIIWEDGHKTVYEKQWLQDHSHMTRGYPELPEGRFRVSFRESARYVADDQVYPSINYEDVMYTQGGIKRWVQLIHRYGFAFVKSTPSTPEATEALLRRIAFIRETHYGAFWDFTADLAKKDMAYTTLGIGAHTDTTYFTDPARLQMFHLLSHTEGSGGKSLLIDAFEAARKLWDEDKLSYQLLSTIRVPAHASGNDDAMIQPAIPFPVLNHHPITDELYQVRWNNEDRAAQCYYNRYTLNAWYTAAHKWNDIISRPSMQRWFQLEPGTPMIFDNWRMLHGRSSFDGKRRICGGYINNDDFESRLKIFSMGRENILKKL